MGKTVRRGYVYTVVETESGERRKREMGTITVHSVQTKAVKVPVVRRAGRIVRHGPYKEHVACRLMDRDALTDLEVGARVRLGGVTRTVMMVDYDLGHFVTSPRSLKGGLLEFEVCVPDSEAEG